MATVVEWRHSRGMMVPLVDRPDQQVADHEVDDVGHARRDERWPGLSARLKKRLVSEEHEREEHAGRLGQRVGSRAPGDGPVDTAPLEKEE